MEGPIIKATFTKQYVTVAQLSRPKLLKIKTNILVSITILSYNRHIKYKLYINYFIPKNNQQTLKRVYSYYGRKISLFFFYS